MHKDSNPTTRRALIQRATLATAAAALATIPAIAAPPASVSDPLIGLCDEWHRLYAQAKVAYRGMSHDEQIAAEPAVEKMHDARDALLDRISETPPTTFAGYMAQIGVAQADMRITNPELPDGDVDPYIAAVYRVLTYAARFAEDRREVIAAAPPAVTAAATVAGISEPDPHLVALADRTLALRDAYNASDADDDDEALYAEFWATWEAVRDFTPHSVADIAEKIRVAKPIYEGSDTEDLCHMVVADVERLNGGAA